MQTRKKRDGYIQSICQEHKTHLNDRLCVSMWVCVTGNIRLPQGMGSLFSLDEICYLFHWETMCSFEQCWGGLSTWQWQQSN